MNELVSVIVPIYNVEKYLDRCVKSIIEQTYKHLEIILVDDGSPDNCPKMCDEWAKKDSRIVVLHKTNGGLSSARNAGIKIAKGTYLSFVDSDDYIKNDMIESMVTTMYNYSSDLSCCGRYIVHDNGKIENKFIGNQIQLLSSQEATCAMFDGTIVGEPAWDKVYKKELFDDICFPEGEINEDIGIMPLIFNKANNIVHIPEAYYYYCKNGASITRSGYSNKKSIVLKHLDQIENIVLDLYPNIINNFYAFKAKYSLSMLYLILENRIVKNTFINDYKSYYNNLKKCFIYFITSKTITKSEKIKGILVVTKLYLPLKNIKKILKK